MQSIAGLALAIFLVAPQSEDVRQVNLDSLLEELLDRSRIAEFPEPEFLCKQFSSYDRRAKEPGNADWYGG